MSRFEAVDHRRGEKRTAASPLREAPPGRAAEGVAARAGFARSMAARGERAGTGIAGALEWGTGNRLALAEPGVASGEQAAAGERTEVGCESEFLRFIRGVSDADAELASPGEPATADGREATASSDLAHAGGTCASPMPGDASWPRATTETTAPPLAGHVARSEASELEELIRFAAVTHGEDGLGRFELGMRQGVLDGMVVQLRALGGRRVSVRVRGGGSTARALDWTGLVESLRCRGIEVVTIAE